MNKENLNEIKEILIRIRAYDSCIYLLGRERDECMHEIKEIIRNEELKEVEE